MRKQLLFVGSEAYPLAKTGGLADVCVALPMALADLGVDVRLVLPGYEKALSAAANKVACVKLDNGTAPTQLVSARMPDTGLPVWLVDSPSLYRRSGGPYPDGRRMQTTAMAKDFGWNKSAGRYMTVYRKLAPQAQLPAASAELMRELPAM